MATVSVSKKLHAPIQQVWAALTDPSQMKQWYFHVRDYEPKVGNVFTFYEKETGGTFLHRCEILAVEPPRLFEHTWEHPSHSKGVSKVRWELKEETGGGCTLTLTHTGLENFADAGPEFAPENYEMGWKGIVQIGLRNYLYGIKKLVFETDIRAPREKVWQTLWNKETYTRWTAAFTEGSYYKGELEAGGRVQFLAPNGGGMYSDVVFLKENEWVLFSHIGMVKDGAEQPIDAQTERWTGSTENYVLTETPQGTHLKVEVDTEAGYMDQMNRQFPEALQKLKQMSEAG